MDNQQWQELDQADRTLSPSERLSRISSMTSWSTRSPSTNTSPDPFSVLPRRCFCVLPRPDGSGYTTPCRARVTVQGRFVDGSGREWNVYSCPAHARALGDARPITSG